MLDPWIIEKIRRREEERRRDSEAQVELPLERRYHEREEQPASEPEIERGVVVIDM